MSNEYAIIENTVIVNVAVAEPNYANEQEWILLPIGFGIGDFYIDGEFVKSSQPQPTPEEVTKIIVNATQLRLDDFAKTRNYDGILSLCTYATSTVPKFQTEGQYGVTARDDTWAKLYEIMAEVEAGTRPMPEGYSDIEPELPLLKWPVKPEEQWSV